MTFGCRIIKEDTITHYFLIADDPADLLYLFIYESPVGEWDQAWKVGKVLLSKFFVNLSE